MDGGFIIGFIAGISIMLVAGAFLLSHMRRERPVSVLDATIRRHPSQVTQADCDALKSRLRQYGYDGKEWSR